MSKKARTADGADREATSERGPGGGQVSIGIVAALRERLSRTSYQQWLLVLFTCAFAVRAMYLFEIRQTEFFRILVGDGAAYDQQAVGIQSDWVGKGTFYQAPLYPYVLAAIYSVYGHDTEAVRWLQIALGSAACVLLALAGRRFVSPRAGLVAGLLLAVYAPAIFFDGLVQKASLDLFLMCFLLFALSKIDENEQSRSPALGAGLALGALALTRENALVLAPLVVLWMGYRFYKDGFDRRLARPIALFVLGIGLILTPVVARNYWVGREFVLTTAQFGANFYIGNNAQADGKYDPLRWGHGSYPLERQDAFEMAEQDAGRPLTPTEVSSYWSGRAWTWIRSHPIDWLKLMGRKWLLIWNANEIADSDEPKVYEDASAVLTVAEILVVFGTICPLAVAGMVATWPDRRRLAILYAILLGIAGTASLFVVFARYRFPMVPVLLLFAAAGTVQVVGLARQRKKRELLSYGALIAVAAAALRVNLGNEENPRATAYYNLAVSLEHSGKEDRAEANYESAINAKPDFVQAHVNLGGLLARRGNFEAAIAEERTALSLRENDAIAHTNLANALFELGHFDEAELHYRSAVRIEPDLAEAKSGLSALSEARKQLAR